MAFDVADQTQQPSGDAASGSEPRLSVLMPVYNERDRVGQAIRQVADADIPVPFEVIVVDDGSNDGTSEILDSERWPEHVTVLHSTHNRGKGAAVRTALQSARGEFSAIFDADLEYDPSDLAVLLKPILDGEANVTFGVRAFDGYTSHSFLYVLGNRFVTLVANVLFNVYIGDLMTCHKAMRTDLFRSLPLRADGFTIEPEIVARVVQRGERVYEVPVRYKARGSDEGKKLNWVDGLRVFATLVRCRFTRR
jgi:glycosyltransferase involved in cell wall biosynthesis